MTVSVLRILVFLELAFLSLLIWWMRGGEQEEQCILDTYVPALVYESERTSRI